MERLMEYVEPKVGDVFLVPAKTVHAIGAGCLILEVQEPTDFTIQPEHFCDEYELNDKEMYIGLTKDEAVECFNFGKAPKAEITPETVLDRDGVKVEKLIKPSDTDCFILNRITLTGGEYTPNTGSYGVYIVTARQGRDKGGDITDVKLPKATTSSCRTALWGNSLSAEILPSQNAIERKKRINITGLRRKRLSPVSFFLCVKSAEIVVEHRHRRTDRTTIFASG